MVWVPNKIKNQSNHWLIYASSIKESAGQKREKNQKMSYLNWVWDGVWLGHWEGFSDRNWLQNWIWSIDMLNDGNDDVFWYKFSHWQWFEHWIGLWN